MALDNQQRMRAGIGHLGDLSFLSPIFEIGPHTRARQLESHYGKLPEDA